MSILTGGETEIKVPIYDFR